MPSSKEPREGAARLASGGSSRLGLAVSAAASLALLVLTLHFYNAVISHFSPSLVAEWRIKHLRFIPVIADEGSILAISLSIAGAMLPLHLYARRRVKLQEALEEQLAVFLAVYASIAASSRSTAEALARASQLLGPPLGTHMEYMARLYSVTGDIRRAHAEATRSTTRRVRLLTRSIVAAARSGGNPARVLAAAAAYSREMRRLIKLIRSRLGEYSFVVSLASITYAVSAGVVVYLVKTMMGASLPGLSTTGIDVGVLLGMYYYALLMITVASAVVIARVIHGYTSLAPKYIALLILIGTVSYLAAPLMLSGAKTIYPQH